MNTGVFKPEENAYPGIFIRGEDALAFAGWLKATDEQREVMEQHGVENPTRRLLALLESCKA
jgi:hypothetical protein